MATKGHVISVGEMRKAYKILVGNLNGTDSFEDLGIDGEIIYNRSYRNVIGGCGMDSSGSG
jgi:hypothetical protein